MIAALGVCALAASSLLRGGSRGHDPRDASEARPPERGSAGPAWPGEIEARDIALPLPAALAAGYTCLREMETWRFAGRDRDGVAAAARAAGVAQPEVERMLALARCDAGGCSVTPDLALVAALGRRARGALYQGLRGASENRLQVFPFLRPRALGPWSELPGLDPRVRELLAEGTWSVQGNLAFSDLPWLCNALETDAQRSQALDALRTRYGLDAWVRVPPAGDLEPMVRYWSAGSDAEEVRAVLLAARRGEGRVPMGELLPVMARARLNRFPQPADLNYDCFWTAVNFFEGASPSDRFLGPDGIVTFVRSMYAEVQDAEARLGDVYVFEGPDGRFAHTANLVAGDVLFTKNGAPHTRPWVLMRLGDVRARYPHTTTRVYRRR